MFDDIYSIFPFQNYWASDGRRVINWLFGLLEEKFSLSESKLASPLSP